MQHSRRLEVLVQHLAGPVPAADGRRRRALLGAILERKAAGGVFDLELLHHWLDVGLTRTVDRALFGLDPGESPRVPRAVMRSDRVPPAPARRTTR